MEMTLTANPLTQLQHTPFFATPINVAKNANLKFIDIFTYNEITNLARIEQVQSIAIGMVELAASVNRSVRTISRSIARLLKAKVLGRFRGGNGAVSSYYLPLEEAAKVPAKEITILEPISLNREALNNTNSNANTTDTNRLDTIVNEQVIKQSVATEVVTDTNSQLNEPSTIELVLSPATEAIKEEIYHNMTFDDLVSLRTKLNLANLVNQNCKTCMGIGLNYAENGWLTESYVVCPCIPLIQIQSPILAETINKTSSESQIEITNNPISTDHLIINKDNNSRQASAVTQSKQTSTSSETTTPKSKHSLDTCLKFAYAEAKAKGKILNPEGFGRTIYASGNQDFAIGQYLRLEAQLRVGGI